MHKKKKLLCITVSSLLISSLSGVATYAAPVENAGVESTTDDTKELTTGSAITFADETFDTRASNLNLSAWIKVGGMGGPGYYQKFTKSGFQKYYQQSYFLQTYYGYISGFDGKSITLTVDFFNMNNKLYHSNPKTGASSRGLTTINGDIYYFDENVSDPCAYKGWLEMKGDKYYFGDDFKAKKDGFHIIDKKTHFFDKEGKLVKGFQIINDRVYSLSSTGDINTGWYSFSTGERFYFDPAQGGAAYRGWLKTDPAGHMYFHEVSGVMQKGVTKIGDDTYVFVTNPPGNNAFKKFGWYTDTSNSKRYYFDQANDGKAVKGTKTIDGKSYTFSNEGVLQK